MAEVQDPPPAQEPSMEEILASIRKIISDENPAPAPAGEAQSEVIELTQMVQDDGSVVDLAPITPPEVTPMPAEPPPPAPQPPPPPPPPPEPASVVEAETLVSEPAASASATVLSALASTIEIERLASEPRSSTFVGNGSRTLEDMVIELMRPLLKQWLDQNLPATVDRLVQKEIDRISKRAKD